MKKSMTLMCLALLWAGAPLMAQQPVKIGIVDGDIVIQQSVKGKRFFEKFTAFNEKKRDEIKGKVEAFQAKEKEFNATRGSLSDDKLQATARDLQNMQTDIKRMQEDAKRESDNMLNEQLAKFQKELAPIIEKMAVDDQFDIILNNGPGANFLFFSSRVNITQKVIDLYDATVKD